jgi:diguanylate cyclase (GGDEF)-like protein/PAS domain S-box-containing protein
VQARGFERKLSFTAATDAQSRRALGVGSDTQESRAGVKCAGGVGRGRALADARVLYAEDDAMTREQLASYLQRRVAELYVAADGAEALGLFRTHRPDIVVTDIRMTRLDGLELSREVKACDPAVPIVVTTAHSDGGFLLQAIELGVERYVLKPIDTAKLVAALEFCANAAQAARNLRLAQAVVESVSDALVILDGEGRVCTVNPAFTNLTGWTVCAVTGQPLGELLGGQDVELRSHLGSGSSATWRGEFWLRRADGRAFCALGSLDLVPSDRRGGARRVLKFFDHSETRRAHEQMWRLAHHDALTGLPNRLLADEALRETLSASQAAGRSFAVLFIDLDRFKAVNDTHGHDTGDSVLREAAHRIAGSVRAGDLVSRRSGDEFVVLLREVSDQAEADAIAGRVRAAMTLPMVLDGNTLHVGCSVGVAVYPVHGDCPVQLLRHADHAMYRAKAGVCEHAEHCEEIASCGGKRPGAVGRTRGGALGCAGASATAASPAVRR